MVSPCQPSLYYTIYSLCPLYLITYKEPYSYFLPVRRHPDTPSSVTTTPLDKQQAGHQRNAAWTTIRKLHASTPSHLGTFIIAVCSWYIPVFSWNKLTLLSLKTGSCINIIQPIHRYCGISTTCTDILPAIFGHGLRPMPSPIDLLGLLRIIWKILVIDNKHICNDKPGAHASKGYWTY